MTPHDGRRVPPFGNPRIKARQTAPRGLSQSTTSFIGPWCQGIHRTPIKTTHNTGKTTPQTPPRTTQQDQDARHTTKTHHREQRYSRPLYSSQPTHPHPHNPPTPPPQQAAAQQEEGSRSRTQRARSPRPRQHAPTPPPQERGRAGTPHPPSRTQGERGACSRAVRPAPPTGHERTQGARPCAPPPPRRPLDP